MIDNKRVLAIIPARLGSTRLPRKILRDIAGKSLIRRVYEQALKVSVIDQVVIAVDAEETKDHVRAFGATAVMTSPDHISGTDRCAEVAAMHPEFELVINIQGDEPFVDPGHLDMLAHLIAREGVSLATLICPLTHQDDFINPNVVKVVTDHNGNALYFSRASVPFQRAKAAGSFALNDFSHRHIGLYAYRRQTLMEITKLPPGQLEQIEMLEQLRWLEAGLSIYTARVNAPEPGIDTEEDLDRACAFCLGREGEKLP